MVFSFRITGYAIIQLPGFFRACYMAIRRYLIERKENKKTKSNKIEVGDVQIDQTNTKSEPPHVGKDESLNLKKYLHFKLQLIHNLEKLTTINDLTFVRKSDLQEMFTKEIDLLTQLLDK